MNKENKYYVYLHRRLDGSVFYVGSGQGPRCKSKCNRSKAWKLEAEKGYKIEKVCTGLSEFQSRKLELYFQEKHKETIVNIHKPSTSLSISEDILNLFMYSENSPSGLVYRESGLQAGYAETRNGNPHRWRIKIKGVGYAIHRIVYSLFNTLEELQVVDHIDGNPHNNRVENLRAVDKATNARNMKPTKTNKSGVRGVHFKTNRDGNTHWVASWRDGTNKLKSKNFMVGCYGYEQAFNLACEYRKKMIEELRAKGFDYTDRHIGAE